MLDSLIEMIENKCPGAKPLFLVIRGSHSYGTNIETSDFDYGGVFIQAEDDILGNKYIEQINDDTNDIVIYEVKRYLELLGTNNPNILELLNTPEDCILYKDPIFDIVLENKDVFISKACANSFGGYAVQQIKKAKGQNKKQNWEKDKIKRKDVLDFLYVMRGSDTIKWKKFAERYYLKQDLCGLVNMNHAKNVYALYYGNPSYKGLVKIENGEVVSNQLKLSSIPKEESVLYYVYYNLEGYESHCKDYRSYQTWLKERNEARWVDVKSHNQKIDGKNMMHCKRLLEMAIEIGEGKGINVRRNNAKELIDVRKGRVDLEKLIEESEDLINKMDEVFEKSGLPKKPDMDKINNILVKIRKETYKKI